MWSSVTAGFGIEKLGLLSLRNPWLSLLVVALITPLMVYGASKLEFSSDIREIFRSAGDEFERLDTVEERFPGHARRVEIVIDSDETFSPQELQALQELHRSLAAMEGVGNVLSMFSAVGRPEGNTAPAPLFPAHLGELEDWDDLRRHATINPLVADRLLSKDGSLAVFAINLDATEHSPDGERRLIGKIKQAAEKALTQTDLRVRLTGLAVMRAEIVDELASDQRLFRFIALGIGLIICWIFFGRLSLVAVAGIPAAIAVSWLLGGMWLADQKINLLTGVAPTIVLVIVFSDCVHLLFSIRAAVARGETLDAATDRAVRQVGPACVLTSLTTTLALASLIFVPHPFISRFGLTAAAGTAVALIVTLTTVPALSLFLLRGYARQERGRSERNLAFRAVDAVCRAAGAAVLTAPRTIAALGLLIVLAGGWLHSMNEPRYSYASNLPEGNQALAAIEAVNAKLAGANTLMVFIDWPDDYEFLSLNTLEAVRDVHAILAEEKALGAISSLHGIEEWLGGDEDEELRLVEFLEQAQEQHLVTALVAPEHKSALVTAQFKNMDSAELVPILERIEQRLNNLRQNYPQATFAITGIVPISATASYGMLQQLNRSLLIAIGLILILLPVAMHSLEVGLVSILPNLFPLSVGGAYLYLFEGGLQFTGLVAFTVGFGIAVDSTIHMLNRYRLERAEGHAIKAAVQRMIASVGPVIIVSTVVLAAGIGTSILSELPMVRLYGSVAVIVLGAALVGDLLFLPAVMAVVERWRVIDWGRRAVSRRLKTRERS